MSPVLRTIGDRQDVAFRRSDRRLIGDDEHAWSDDGVFNIEGGCYAKTIRLSAEKEPQIFNAIRFGSVLENVPLDRSREFPISTAKNTRRTRGPATPSISSPITSRAAAAAIRRRIFFLTCDAFGVMPPISRLTPEQAMDHFLCGYTAKVAGTGSRRHDPASRIQHLLRCSVLAIGAALLRRVAQGETASPQRSRLALNTGWTGGGVGIGERIKLKYTRAMLEAALTGQTGWRRHFGPIRFSASRCRLPVPACPRLAQSPVGLARRGGLRPRGRRLGRTIQEDAGEIRLTYTECLSIHERRPFHPEAAAAHAPIAPPSGIIAKHPEFIWHNGRRPIFARISNSPPFPRPTPNYTRVGRRIPAEGRRRNLQQFATVQNGVIAERPRQSSCVCACPGAGRMV